MFEDEFKGVESIRLESAEVTVEGNMAHELGRAYLKLHSGGAVTARYSVLWLRGTDGWRVKVDFIASDAWAD